MAHGLLTFVDWALGSGGSMMTADDDDDDVSPLLPPHRHTRTFVRAYTRPLPRVSRVSALVVVVVVVVDDGVWRSVDATALDVDPPSSLSLCLSTAMGSQRTRNRDQRLDYHRPTGWPLPTTATTTTRTVRLVVWNRLRTGWGTTCSSSVPGAVTKPKHGGPIVDAMIRIPNGALHTDWVLYWHAPLIPIPPAHA